MVRTNHIRSSQKTILFDDFLPLKECVCLCSFVTELFCQKDQNLTKTWRRASWSSFLPSRLSALPRTELCWRTGGNSCWWVFKSMGQIHIKPILDRLGGDKGRGIFHLWQSQSRPGKFFSQTELTLDEIYQCITQQQNQGWEEKTQF